MPAVDPEVVVNASLFGDETPHTEQIQRHRAGRALERVLALCLRRERHGEMQLAERDARARVVGRLLKTRLERRPGARDRGPRQKRE